MSGCDFIYFLLWGREFILTKLSAYFFMIKGISFLISLLLLILVIFLERKIKYFEGKLFCYMELFGVDTQKIIWRKKMNKLFKDIHKNIDLRENFEKFLQEIHQFLDDVLKYKGYKGENLQQRIRNYSSQLLTSYNFFAGENNSFEKKEILLNLRIYQEHFGKLI